MKDTKMNDVNVKKNTALLITVSILSFLYIIGGIIPLDSFWGFNHLRYLPDFSLFVFAILIVIIAVPSLSEKLYQICKNTTSTFNSLPKLIRILLIAMATSAILYFLRVHVHSLGDGYQRIYQIEKGYLHYFSEPLDFYLHALLYKLLKVFETSSGELSYVLFSIVSGILFTVLIYLYKTPEKIRNYSVMIKTMALFSGGSLLFFGYVESYSLNFMFSILYILYSLKFIYDKTSLGKVVTFLLLASVSHITALVLYPSFLYLMYSHIKNNPELSPIRKFLPIVLSSLPIQMYFKKPYYLTNISKTKTSGG